MEINSSIIMFIVQLVISVIIYAFSFGATYGILKTRVNNIDVNVNNRINDVNNNINEKIEKIDCKLEKHNRLIERMAIAEINSKTAFKRIDELRDMIISKE